jgi:hypothetical protein
MGSAVLQMMIIANRVVYPAQGVKESADALCYKAFGMTRTNAVVRHQGRCVPPPGEGGNTYTREQILLRLGITEDEQKPAVVMGCGLVHMRKSVEYFIEAARYCKELIDRPIRFIWVGGGYHPDTDLHYSAWLKSQIIHSGLEEEVVFFEETDDLGPFFDLADVFFLSSRLDPFPNVAIDAVMAEVPVVAFERATGFAEFIHEHPTVGVAVPFLDVTAAAKAIHEYMSGERARPVRDDAILKQLSFAGYANFVWEECQAAIAHQKAVDEESDLLIKSKLMDADFFKSAQPNWQSVLTPEYVYVSMWSRGIKTAKSRVGFNDLLAEGISTHIASDTQSITPLANVLKSSASPLTHKTIFIDPNEASKPFGNTITVALHIHAYYIEALPALLRRLGDVGRRVWLCITTDTEEKAKAVKSIAESLSFDVNVVVMPNRGRDVGPFIMAMKEHLSHFDVVGHFHLKGTKQLEQTVVRQWQEFLYDSLLGKHGELANVLLNAFEQDPKLGLCFQEDPCLPSWGKNRELADGLLASFGIDRLTPDIIEYPTGNMFWVRTAALAPLLQQDWQWSDFPAEPVPYDGSILHALERLTPVICEAAGFDWATVHNTSARRYYLQA